MADNREIDIDVLAAVIREAADHLDQVEEQRICNLMEAGDDAASASAAAEQMRLVDAAASSRTLITEERLLEYRTYLLFNEHQRLEMQDDDAGCDAHRHKLRQHYARLQGTCCSCERCWPPFGGAAHSEAFRPGQA